MTDPAAEEGQRRPSWRWTVAATFVFGCALTTLFWGFWGQDFTKFVPANLRPPSEVQGMQEKVWEIMGVSDLQFSTGTTARNAFTLLTRPWRIFQAEQCYPDEKALALGEPMISQGILAMPAYILTRDPVATFNLLLIGLSLFSALAMYWLIREWTGVPGAGIVAGLVYAFHQIKTGDLVHFYVWDSVWTVLAFMFATRLFVRPRWREAIGLACCCALQIGGSLYPLLSATILALPFMVWLVISHGVRNLRWEHWACVVAAIGVAAFVVFSPYLEQRSEGVLQARSFQAYLPYAWLLPGERLFPGWALPGFALLGLALGRRRAVGEAGGDPRWALLIGAMLVLYLAAGGNRGDRWLAVAHHVPLPPELPNLFEVLRAIVPGLDVVRAPAAIVSGTHLAVSILAGFGAAALIRVFPPRYAIYAATILICLTFVDTLLPGKVGLTPRTGYAAIRIGPSTQSIDFYQKLERLGNSGPILELPFNAPTDPRQRGETVLLTAYHHRQTSQCYNSFFGSGHDQVKAISKRLPSYAALVSLRELGFTTIVVHHRGTRSLRKSFEKFVAQAKGGPLEKILTGRAHTAYAIQAGARTRERARRVR